MREVYRLASPRAGTALRRVTIGPVSAPRLFCFGLGFTALALARQVRELGWSVAGTSRPGSRLEELRGAGWEVHVWGPGSPLAPEALGGATHVLSSVPPAAGVDPVLAAHGGDLRSARWVGYLSATSVYGDQGGSWVEAATTPCRPTGARGRERLAAEQAWSALAGRGMAVHVFRLAGLYGPGRSALDRVRAGDARRVVKPGLLFSRVHVDDAASALRASALDPRPGAIYDVADDEPAPPEDVVTHACALLGVTPPPAERWDEVAATLSPALAAFYADSKRVSARRLREELGWRPRYPDYRAGLAALLADGH